MLKLVVLLYFFGCAYAQFFSVCINDRSVCNSLSLGDSQVSCMPVDSRVDCALKLANNEVDIGVFNEEETVLLGQIQPTSSRIVATIRDIARNEPYAFEAVAIVPATFSGTIQNLKGFNYCHPGLETTDIRWSPRILKEFEATIFRSGLERCPGNPPPGKTVDELEVERLAGFFAGGCRPGAWSYNATIDANLKRDHANLCSLCGTNCTAYTTGVSVAGGVDGNNRHIQALQCMTANNNAVAYVAWQHVREYFPTLNNFTAYAVLCPDGTTHPLTEERLNNATAPCSFVRQPWGTVIANSAKAADILRNLRTWWPNGVLPASVSWQNTLFTSVIGGSSALVVFDDAMPTPSNYTGSIRTVPSIDSSDLCQPARRWCTLSTAELAKCNWVRTAAHSLGLQPTITCLQRPSIFECLEYIKDNKADLIASGSNYGYLARQHFKLIPVKLLQNHRTLGTRVAAFVKASTAQANVTRFESLRGKKACFPEYGGIAFVSFVRAAHERSIIQRSECDYARAVDEFFGGACAPGAVDAWHSITSNSDYNATNLCSVCQPANATAASTNNYTCAWDYSNKFFGVNGSLACLNDPSTEIAFFELTNIEAKLQQLNLQASQFRALCSNNTLALNPGFVVAEECLLALTVDAEVVTRRDDPLYNALSVLLEGLDVFFGYNAAVRAQLINLEIFSPFGGTSDLLFKDTAIGFTEPSLASTHLLAKNYVELFHHLDTCNRAVPVTERNLFSMVVLVVMATLTRLFAY